MAAKARRSPAPCEPYELVNSTSRLIRRSTSPRRLAEHHVPSDGSTAVPFSYFEYFVFMLLGAAMLWAWNMFFAAVPYFQFRFRDEPVILSRFQAAETSVASVAELATMVILTELQTKASYPWRIGFSLVVNMICFTLLALSTKIVPGASPFAYFGFLLTMVLATNVATGFMQNGSMAVAAGFGRPEYMQSIMTGQAISGILPPFVQFVSATVAASRGPKNGQGDKVETPSAAAFFFTATGVAGVSLWAFLELLRRRRNIRGSNLPSASGRMTDADTEATTQLLQSNGDVQQAGHDSDADQGLAPEPALLTSTASLRKSVSLFQLARKLRFRATAVFITFCTTMCYPVFTAEVVTKNPSPPAFLSRAAFIPLAFFIWSVGDLLGRLIPLYPRLCLAQRPRLLILLSILRIAFIPLYLLCNRDLASVSPHPEPGKLLGVGESSTTSMAYNNALPDWVYLLLVQLPFGTTNGYLGTCAMMGAANDEGIEDGEREAAGSFMGLMLVLGLSVGSFLSLALE